MSKSKVVLRKSKNGHIYDPDSLCVFKSQKEKLVIGTLCKETDTVESLNDETLALAEKKYGFEIDKSLYETEEAGEEEEEDKDKDSPKEDKGDTPDGGDEEDEKDPPPTPAPVSQTPVPTPVPVKKTPEKVEKVDKHSDKIPDKTLLKDVDAILKEYERGLKSVTETLTISLTESLTKASETEQAVVQSLTQELKATKESLEKVKKELEETKKKLKTVLLAMQEQL